MYIRFYITAFLLLISSNLHAYGNDFSCPYGKQGACLDYNDKVCSSYSMCVSQNATCFDANTCNYKGFICKSKFDNLANEYDDLAAKCRNIAQNYDDLVDNYNSILNKYKNLSSCINYASSLEEAKSCAY